MKCYRIFLSLTTMVFSCFLSSSQDVSRALAEIAILTESEEITEEAIVATHKALIDVYGVSFAAIDFPGVQEILQQEKEWGGNPHATAWIDGAKLAAPNAAFFNSVLVHALDMDDIHIPSVTHITSVVVPAAIAVGEDQNATGREVIEAIILGIEVATRVGNEYAPRREHGGFLPTSIAGGFGSAAASSRLLGLTVEQTMDALGIWYAHASGNRTALVDHTLTKRIQPAIACRAGVVAAYYAKRGITGPHDIFLSGRGLFRIYGANTKPYPTVEDIKAKQDFFEIERISYKKYASCGAKHALLEAAIELSEKYNLTLKEIDKIEIFIGRGGLVGVPWDPSARNPHVSAQFCAPYAVVSAIKNRRYGPAETTNERIKEDIEVSEMAKEVIFRQPERGLQAVAITLNDGRKLENSNPVHERFFTVDYMSYQDIVEKYEYLLEYSGLISSNKAELLLEDIENLQNELSIRDFSNQHLRIR